MFQSLDSFKAVECVKVIVDSIRCEICDNTNGERRRHPCGHSVCDSCAEKATNCLICLTPPIGWVQQSTRDRPFTERATHSIELLKSFQDTFGIDVFERQKICKQLKTEKEVFPDCIQAPKKYFNRRKSSIVTKDKENREPLFPGEGTSVRTSISFVGMEKSYNYVQQWLDNNEAKSSNKLQRKPLASLNTNQRIPRRADKILAKVKENSEIKRKNLSIKLPKAPIRRRSLLDKYLKPVDKVKNTSITEHLKKCDSNVCNRTTETEKDESGIVIDDEPVVIDESQSVIIDKDRLAWLAVLEANEKDPYISSQSLRLKPNVSNECSKNVDWTKQTRVTNNVLFYKKSKLVETCKLCMDNEKNKKNGIAKDDSKDVSIVIENNSFTTTITMSSIENQKCLEKRSVHVQTDISEINVANQHTNNMHSLDLFTADVKSCERVKNDQSIINEKWTKKQIMISDSDTDEANESSIIQVTADVHRSSNHLENDILMELDQCELQNRRKRCGRGLTPNSSDSSDKENFDPNKPKRIKHNKKGSKKRKINDNFQLNPIFSLND